MGFKYNFKNCNILTIVTSIDIDRHYYIFIFIFFEGVPKALRVVVTFIFLVRSEDMCMYIQINQNI